MQIVKALGHLDLVMHDMRRTALDIFKKAGLILEDCKRWLGHKTDSIFAWYSIDEDEIIEQGEKIAASLRTRRKSAAASWILAGWIRLDPKNPLAPDILNLKCPDGEIGRRNGLVRLSTSRAIYYVNVVKFGERLTGRADANAEPSPVTGRCRD